MFAGADTVQAGFLAHYLNERRTRRARLRADLALVAEAHHDFEAALGRPDEDWQGWYAGRLEELGWRRGPAPYSPVELEEEELS